MIASLRSLWNVLTSRSRRGFALLALFSTIAGLLETTSVGLIIPFIAAATDTGPFGGSRLWVERWQAQLAQLGVSSEFFAPAFALLFLAGNLVANSLVVYYQWFALKLVFEEKALLSTRLLSHLSRRPLSWYEQQNSAELSKSVMADVDRVILSLSSLAQLVAILIRVSILAAFFLVAQLRLALSLACGLFLAFYIVFRFIHRPLVAAGEQSVRALKGMFELANDVFAGARELKATGSSGYFVGRFQKAAQASVQPEVIRGMPPHVTRVMLETMILSVIMVALVYFQLRDGNLANGLPILSAYAIAGIRLLPALQQALFHWVQIRFLNPSVFRVEELLQGPELEAPQLLDLPFEREIRFQEVSFAYPGSESTITQVNLEITKNMRVALVGATGAGKTTVMDLLLGLREASEGTLWIDDQPLNAASASAWRKKIGYVPQNIYLLDASILENVAFGIPPQEIDPAQVRRACTAANIHDFISQELPLGYQTPIGERGVRLSGGQCQRLSIARALYHDPPVILFDEATSALDGATEELILQALDGLRGRKTLVVVAHRLNTVWDFDTLFVFERGRLVGRGRAQDLLESCPTFRSLTRQGAPDSNVRSIALEKELSEQV